MRFDRQAPTPSEDPTDDARGGVVERGERLRRMQADMHGAIAIAHAGLKLRQSLFGPDGEAVSPTHLLIAAITFDRVVHPILEDMSDEPVAARLAAAAVQKGVQKSAVEMARARGLMEGSPISKTVETEPSAGMYSSGTQEGI